MTTAAYTYKHRHERHVSLTRLSVILANLGLWAGLIVGLAVIAR
ncbi:hypothetical protein [Caulobacter sp. UNC279MFTsu5.1]|nr:hypothetical protein [Caulobacter sp. UNC279MFTsu5.1]SFI82116.1 hypothetical protein SAMN02799626_00594 [Caulobacter sp. UNC279MFTsu5.1]